MPNGYMNSAEKQSFAYASAAIVALDDAMANVQSGLPRAVSGDFKRAQYFLSHGLETWIAPMDTKTRKSILNIVKDLTLGVVDKKSGKVDTESHERYLYGKEHIMDLVETTLTTKCSSCDGACRDSCSLYAAYQHFGLPGLDENHSNCPYSGVSA